MIANILTLSRMVGSGALLFLKPLTVSFYTLYFFCGITDILDGFIARITKTTSKLGAKLDSVADLLFYTILIVKILPILKTIIPNWIWVWVILVLGLRIFSYAISFIKNHEFYSPHTYLNKTTGFLVFLVPCFMKLPFFVVFCTVLGVVSTAAVIWDIILNFKSAGNITVKKYDV